MKTGKRVHLFFAMIGCFFAVLALGGSVHVSAEKGGTVFSTWEGFEVDKCASIWLITEFINKDATIKFFPKSEYIEEGIPFDTPDAKLRRYHNMSTYESLLKHYKVVDPRLVYIGKIVHDIEVNVWEKKVLKETHAVESAVRDIIETSKDRSEILQRSGAYFDNLYKESPAK